MVPDPETTSEFPEECAGSECEQVRKKAVVRALLVLQCRGRSGWRGFGAIESGILSLGETGGGRSPTGLPCGMGTSCRPGGEGETLMAAGSPIPGSPRVPGSILTLPLTGRSGSPLAWPGHSLSPRLSAFAEEQS